MLIHLSRLLGTLSLAVLILAAFAFSPAHAAPVAPELVPFADRTLTLDSQTYKYQVFVPKHLDKKKKAPVILFLHGIGERGVDGRIQTKNGIRLLIAQDVENFPAIVVCPQLQPDMRWTQKAMQTMALAMLDQSISEFYGDPRRVYLTGLSLGGYGTWEMARQYPQRWAAIAPVCGGVVYPDWVGGAPAETTASEKDPYSASARAVASLPIWAFHGEADPTVPVAESRQIVASLLALKADVRYSEYPGVGHDSWNNAYAEPGLLPWFLSHKKAK